MLPTILYLLSSLGPLPTLGGSMVLNVDLPLKDANDFVAGWLILSLQYKDADSVIKKTQRVLPTYESLI